MTEYEEMMIKLLTEILDEVFRKSNVVKVDEGWQNYYIEVKNQ